MGDSHWISTRTPEFRALLDPVKVATRISSWLGANSMDGAESIQK